MSSLSLAWNDSAELLEFCPISCDCCGLSPITKSIEDDEKNILGLHDCAKIRSVSEMRLATSANHG